jgi:hypothetical protein
MGLLQNKKIICGTLEVLLLQSIVCVCVCVCVCVRVRACDENGRLFSFNVNFSLFRFAK